MSRSRFFLQLDPTPHERKPEGGEIGAVTRRLQQAGPTPVSFEELAKVIESGGTWCGGCYEAKPAKWGPFMSMQVFGLDFDNSSEYLRRDGSKGKRPLLPDERGYLTPAEALERCAELELWPLCIHYTMHHDAVHNVRYRIIFDMGEPVTTEAEAERILSILLSSFPEADQKCSNANRLFFGALPGSKVRDLRGWRP